MTSAPGLFYHVATLVVLVHGHSIRTGAVERSEGVDTLPTLAQP